MARSSFRFLARCVSVAVLATVGFVSADGVSAAAPAGLSDELLAAMSQTVRGILIEAVPERIEKNDNWGDTRERFSQLKLKTDSGRLRFETNTKPVKHGLWKQIVVVPVDPQNNLKFRIAEAKATGRNTMAFQVVASSPLKLTARVERWRSGVKMLNFSTDAEAGIEMHVAGEVTYEYADIDGKSYLTFRPTITKVDLKLVEFDLRRIGQADGVLVQELGDMLSDPLADQLDKNEPKVAKKLNAAIAKKQDKLKMPMGLPFDFSSWSWTSSSAAAR